MCYATWVGGLRSKKVGPKVGVGSLVFGAYHLELSEISSLRHVLVSSDIPIHQS